jgi:hypothetical protein
MANKRITNPDSQKRFKEGTNIPSQSGYKLEFCEMLIEHGKQGHSFAEFCSAISKSERAAYCWRAKYPEFHAAYEEFMAHSKAWWNQQAQLHLTTYFDSKEGGTRFDTNLFKFITGGRFNMSHQTSIDLPGIESGSLDKRHRAALKALARGEITPNQAATISAMLKDAIDIETFATLEGKLEEIQKKVDNLGQMKMTPRIAEEPEFEVNDG